METIFADLLRSPEQFAALGGITLRAYQTSVAQAVLDAVLERRGLTFAVMFPRQSGKNELQAHIEAQLLYLLQYRGAELVKVSPTWRPQSLNAMRRLERVLERHPLTCRAWEKESGYIYRIGRARITFLSGAPESNIVGATATHLLEVDEAQDVAAGKFDKDIAPMAASTNAVRVFWGTAWSAQTLLAREVRAAREVEMAQPGGPRLAYVLGAEEVAREVPAYAQFVAGQVARLGRSHPLVRTQFFSEEIDAAGGMFPPARMALMRGSHAPRSAPEPGRIYALLLDVAGEDEAAAGSPSETAASAVAGAAAGLANPARDATALTILEVDNATLADPLLRAPTYRVVARRLWLGTPHARLYGEIRALAETWQARSLVVDATGVGAGLASFLARALPGKVLPFTFNAASKSRLGWDFLAICDAGRWKEPAADQNGADPALTLPFFHQLEHTRYTILPGPARGMRWGVPDGSRDPASGEILHDDLVISAALCAELDRQPWGGFSSAQPGIVRAKDPLDAMDEP